MTIYIVEFGKNGKTIIFANETIGSGRGDNHHHMQ